MEDRDLNLEKVKEIGNLVEVEETEVTAETKENDTVDTTDIDTVEETESVDDTEEPVEVPLYLVVEEDGRVVDLSFEDGVFYQNVSEEIDIELIKNELGIGENLYWDGYLYVKEIDWKEENDRLKNEIHGLKQLVADGKKENEEMLLDMLDLLGGL